MTPNSPTSEAKCDYSIEPALIAGENDGDRHFGKAEEGEDHRRTEMYAEDRGPP